MDHLKHLWEGVLIGIVILLVWYFINTINDIQTTVKETQENFKIHLKVHECWANPSGESNGKT